MSTDRYATSRSLLSRAGQSLAGGVSSPFRARFPVPLYFADAAGPRVRDVDGNEFIDYVLAWGPLILGHRHPAIVEAVRRRADAPHIYGAQHELEYGVAEMIQRLVPCAERVAFTSSGSEAVQGALRMARAFTGRNLVVKFEGHYHGWMDSILISYRADREAFGPVEAPRPALGSRGQAPNAADNVLTVSWNDLPALERVFERHGSEIAAVITEPVLCNSGSLMPQPGFLDGVKTIAHSRGALLVFDEIITGFRIAPGGAQAAFGVTPDLATFGKALGGGLTLSAIAGRADVLELIAGGGVVFGGTFNGNPLSLAAAQATLDELSRDEGAALCRANNLGRRLMSGFVQAAEDAGMALAVSGFGAAFSIHFAGSGRLRCYRDTFDEDAALLARFLRLALDEGLFLLPDGRFYVSAAHTERELEETLGGFRRALAKLQCNAVAGR